jgi:hypothetical protein
MAIRVTRNEEGNCITFVGSTNPAYWNACLSAQINPEDSTRIDIINDIRSQSSSDVQYEFYAVPFADFADRDGNAFTTAQDAIDYINANANVTGVSDVGTDLSGETVDFRLDQTSTSIIMDNGSAFGVNTIKAVADADGTIHIHAIGAGVPDGSDTPDDHVHFEGLAHTSVTIDGTAATGGLNDVVNTLNELFTVGPWTQIVVTDPYSTLVANVSGATDTYTLVGDTATDPLGDDIFTNSGSGNKAGLKSDSTISRAGEYFTFDIRGEGQIGFGLVHSSSSYSNGYYVGTAAYADPTSFAVGNSAHYGFQFSHWFHPTPNGSWTNYGASTGYIGGGGWSSWESQDEWLAGDPVKVKVGIDENGFIAISTLQDDDLTWIMHARSSYPVPQGSEFHLGIKASNASPRVYTAPKIHLLGSAPAMYFRYIESPDGEFDYPLFASEEEVEYYDQNHSGTTGTGTWTQVIYPDDPTNTQWYKPDTGFTDAATSAPSGVLFEGNSVTFTEITSLTDADLAPAAFTSSTTVVDELASVNINVHPAGAAWTTTVSGLPTGLSYDSVSGFINGTAPEVTGDNVTNPNDEYAITVTRTNTYGSSNGTLTLRVTNLTAPATAISGFNHQSGSTVLVDSNTMDDGSVVHMNNTLADGKRFIIEQAYIETNILPFLSGTGDKYFIGLAVSGHDFSTLEESDFDAAIVWEYLNATQHRYRFIRNGTTVDTVTINSTTDAFYDYAIEIDGTSAWLIACNVNSINTEPSPSDGGSFSNTYQATSLGTSAPHTIHMAVASTQADFSTSDISQIDTPAAATNSTSWSKALDFSGGAERAQMVSSSSIASPLQMGGTSSQVSAPTAGQTVATGHPWATAIVFKYDGNSSNQHIWNMGEGSRSADDNIYLRLDASGYLYFGIGRQSDFNECRFLYLGTSTNTNHWHGIYIAHNGAIYGTGVTAAELAAAFDIRWFTTNYTGGVWGSWMDNKSTSANWTAGTVGGRMNRVFSGEFTVGGRGSNRNFHGKVASMLVTTLRQGVAMPNDAEITKLVNDPMGWLNDYKVGNSFRYAGNTNETTGFAIGNSNSGWATQVWLMGDGANDSYSNMIRNRVQQNDQNYTKLNMISMVSNDIENVTISGLP